MKSNPARPFVVAASLVAAAAVIGADTAPKKKPEVAPASAPAAAPAGEDKVLATVNGEEIKNSHVDAEIGKILAQRGMPANALPAAQRDQVVRSMLDDMILDKLVTKASAGVKVSDEDVNGEYEKIRKLRGGSEDDVKQELAKMGMTVESLKGQIRDQMQKRKWVDDQVKGKFQEPSEADAKEFYDKNPQHFERPEQVRASHILFRFEENATPQQITEAMKKAETAIARSKKEDFAKLADELTEDPGGKGKGGDLDFFPRQGVMVEPFAEAAFKMKKDEITQEPVRSQFGYHVIKVTDRQTAGKQSFDEVKPRIVDFLGREKKNNAVETVLKDLRGQAKVEVKLPPPAPAIPPDVSTPPAAAPEAKPQPKRKPVEAVTPPVSAPEPKK